MDAHLRLCLEADLQMALAPLAGQQWDILTYMDAKLRIGAVLKKYLPDALTVEPRGSSYGYVVQVTVDPALAETLRDVLRTFRESLDD